MRNADNDNEPSTFQTLAAVTARVLRSTNEKQNEGAAGDSGGGDQDKEKRDERERYVDQRLSELAAFERRASGIKARRIK